MLKDTAARVALTNVGVFVAKTYQHKVPGGSRWEIHFRYAASLVKRSDAKVYAQVYMREEYGVEDCAFFANPKTIDNSFYAIFFTDWR